MTGVARARVRLFGKPGCCLCDEARVELSAVRASIAFELEEIDVSTDPALDRAYGERVPVVEIDGREAFELRVDRSQLASVLRGQAPAEG